MKAQRASQQGKNSNSFNQLSYKQPKLSGLDKLVKKNLRKKGKLDAEEMLKKFMEETQKKLRAAEITERNKEVRKKNAQAAGHPNNEHERVQTMLQKFKEKKKRSKSCIQKSENFFLAQ